MLTFVGRALLMQSPFLTGLFREHKGFLLRPLCNKLPGAFLNAAKPSVHIRPTALTYRNIHVCNDATNGERRPPYQGRSAHNRLVILFPEEKLRIIKRSRCNVKFHGPAAKVNQVESLRVSRTVTESHTTGTHI